MTKVECFGVPGLPVDLTLWDAMEEKGKILLLAKLGEWGRMEKARGEDEFCEDIIMELILVCGVERLECGKTCEDSGALLAISALARRAGISVSCSWPTGPLSFGGREVGWVVDWFWTWAYYQQPMARGTEAWPPWMLSWRH